MYVGRAKLGAQIGVVDQWCVVLVDHQHELWEVT